MWAFIKTVLAMLTAFSIVSVYGQGCLLDFIRWLLIDAFWWTIDNILLPLSVTVGIISLIYLLRRGWKELMVRWEEEPVSMLKRVGE